MKEKRNRSGNIRLKIRQIAIPAAAAGVDLLFPRRCPVCDRPVRFPGKEICPECEPKLIPVREPICRKCGKQLLQPEREYCHDCIRKPHTYDRGIALYTYQSSRAALYRCKYEGRREYAAFFGRAAAKHLGRQIRAWKPDALIPIPLHPERLKKRGYNQAALAAECLGRELDIPVFSDYLTRTRNTLPQKAVEGGLRKINLKNSFKIVQNDVKLSTIVIVDDIYTTGSTIDAAAEVCRLAGVKQIYFVTLAIGTQER